MTCRTIYTTALTLIGEHETDGLHEDYAARTPSLLHVIFSRYAKLSEALSGSTPALDDLKTSSLDDTYPLDDQLIPLCAETLAAMLIIDELPEISEMLSSSADSDAEAIANTLTEISPTREVYGS